MASHSQRESEAPAELAIVRSLSQESGKVMKHRIAIIHCIRMDRSGVPRTTIQEGLLFGNDGKFQVLIVFSMQIVAPDEKRDGCERPTLLPIGARGPKPVSLIDYTSDEVSRPWPGLHG